jgi:hypothetical protein
MFNFLRIFLMWKLCISSLVSMVASSMVERLSGLHGIHRKDYAEHIKASDTEAASVYCGLLERKKYVWTSAAKSDLDPITISAHILELIIQSFEDERSSIGKGAILVAIKTHVDWHDKYGKKLQAAVQKINSEAKSMQQYLSKLKEPLAAEFSTLPTSVLLEKETLNNLLVEMAKQMQKSEQEVHAQLTSAIEVEIPRIIGLHPDFRCDAGTEPTRDTVPHGSEFVEALTTLRKMIMNSDELQIFTDGLDKFLNFYRKSYTIFSRGNRETLGAAKELTDCSVPVDSWMSMAQQALCSKLPTPSQAVTETRAKVVEEYGKLLNVVKDLPRININLETLKTEYNQVLSSVPSSAVVQLFEENKQHLFK